tara:strand:- start:11369 stop:11533 length:165 start_codon:yes stop_codon:yes gene_type:complete
MKYFKKLWDLIPNKTINNTIMWIQVPMSANSVDEKIDIIIATINQLEQNIKLNK